MGLIAQPIALADIANCEAFVQAALKKSGIRFGDEERDELLAEGLTILLELHRGYRPLTARPGIDERDGRFSGYAAWALPKRLGDFWHKSHSEHRYVTGPDGKRGWIYGRPTLSLDALTSNGNAGDGHGGERHLLHAQPINAFCHATGPA